MKELRAVAVLLMLVSLASFSPVMAQQFEVPLTVSDQATTVVLYYGFVNGASNCIVPTDEFNGHAEVMLPPMPPGGIFDTRFISPRTLNAAACYDQGSPADFRPQNSFASGRDTFRVVTQLSDSALANGLHLTISWPAGLGAYFTGLSLRYVDQDTGPVTVDMLTNTSVDVTTAGNPATVNIFSAGLVAPQPMFAVTPANLNFGTVNTSSTKTDTVVVSNPGAGNLNITAINSNNAMFTVSPAAPQTIPGGSSMEFYVTFAPTAAGPQSGTITFVDNAAVPPPPHTVSVSGTGQEAPPSFEFALTAGDGTMRPNTSYTLWFGVYPGADVCINPADGLNGHFEEFLPPPPPGGVFDSRFISPRAANAAVCYDQGSSNDYRPFVDYGQLDTFRVKTQKGDGTVIILSWPSNLATQFETATLRYTDQDIGPVTVNMLTTFSVDVTGAGDPATVNIYTKVKTLGPPPPAQFGVTPASLAFGNVMICPGNSSTQTVTVSNVGGQPLNITNITAPAMYSVSPSAPQTIAGGGSMVFSVTYAPTAVGANNGNISFTHNAAGSPGLVGVTGAGIACQGVSVAPTSLNFGLLPPDGSTTKLDSVTVSNNGLVAATINAINVSNPDYSVSPAAPQTISSGGSMKFYITAGPRSTTACPDPGTVSFDYTGPSSGSLPVSLNACFSFVEPFYVTVTPDSMTIIGGNNYYQRPAYRTRPNKSMPNWANLLQEVVVQGGFQPGTSESDVAGGMRLGESYMRSLTSSFGTYYLPQPIRSDTAWVRLTSWIPARGPRPAFGANWGVLQGTLKSRVGYPPVFYTHDNYARGFDSTLNPGDAHRQLLRGQQYQIYPYRSKNKLFAEMVALKFNIAANDLGKAGSSISYGTFGNLVINLPGNPLNGLSIRAASALVDQYMTFERTAPAGFFDDAYACVYAINRAFVGPLDTTYNPTAPFFQEGSFYRGNSLHVNGVAGASSTGGFLAQGAAAPMHVIPTNDLTEAPYGYDEQDPGMESAEQIPAMKLYQNYPNPFNPTTTINFRLGAPSQVTIKVYNLLGQEVATLLNNEPMVDGYQAFTFDARALTSGVYYYTVSGVNMEDGTEIPRSVGKMLLVK
jgi:hypothetical protein